MCCPPNMRLGTQCSWFLKCANVGDMNILTSLWCFWFEWINFSMSVKVQWAHQIMSNPSIHVWRKLGSTSEFALCIYYTYIIHILYIYIIDHTLYTLYRYIFTLNMLSLAIETYWNCQYLYTISSYVLLTSASRWLAAQGTLVAIAVYGLQGDDGICRVGDGSFCSVLPTPACLPVTSPSF